jgi:hypothetical protein
MTNSETSTERPARRPDASLQPWHFFLLLAMLGATVAVWRSPDTHPAALLLISAAVIASGFAALALYHALAGFFLRRPEPPAVIGRERDDLLREKALVLRSIKELEFDRGMGKVSEADFVEIGSRLRARAMELMQAIDAEPAPAPAPATAPAPVAAPRSTCAACGTVNDEDAKFCKTCGQKLA